MILIHSPKKMQQTVLILKKRGKKIAFVPTMGFLHEGHLKLIHEARKKADVVVVSIFVNPLQFGPKEDLAKYPRDEKGDLLKCKQAGANFVFFPTVKDLYPKNFQTYVEVTELQKELCGKTRPGHFKGVSTVVLKLFNIVQPDIAVFGLKDFQQFALLCQMVKDLNMPIQMVGVPTVREKDGLAMSSRNKYLSEEGRREALSLSQSLKKIKDKIKSGVTDIQKLQKTISDEILKNPSAKIDYISFTDSETLQPLTTYKPKKTLVALAVFIGTTRLIDNLVI